jgi:glucosamine kinase
VPLFLGVDGGGTQTTCVLGDATSVLATATSGASNVTRVGEEGARQALHQAIRTVCSGANVDAAKITRACVGLAGAARPEVENAVRRILCEVVSCELEIVGDMVIAMQAAFGSGPGVIVIAGTGSIAYGRNEAGQTARVGGWGFQISDEGSGYWIGRTAVMQIMRAQDDIKGPSSALARQLLKAWRLNSIEELVPVANATPAPDFAQLFVPVLCEADAGDPIARSVLTRAGTELARLGKLAIGKTFPVPENVPVAMAGGVFRNSALVRQVFYDALQAEYPKAIISPTVVEPVRGALDLARGVQHS